MCSRVALSLLVVASAYLHGAYSRDIDKLSSIKDVVRQAVNGAIKEHCPKTSEGDAPAVASSRCQRACPAGFTACAGRCYALQMLSLNYTQSEERCAELGARLAEPRSRAENLCVAGLSERRRVWLGLTDRQQEGTFVAADGTPLSDIEGYRWGDLQPDDYRGIDPAGEHCVEMSVMFRFAEWNDESCASSLFPMCQLD